MTFLPSSELGGIPHDQLEILTSAPDHVFVDPICKTWADQKQLQRPELFFGTPMGTPNPPIFHGVRTGNQCQTHSFGDAKWDTMQKCRAGGL